MASVEAKENMDSTAPPPSIISTHHQLKLSFLVVFNATLMLLGTGGPFLLRLYFVRGGHRMWLSAFLQVCAWPILLLPLSISHLFPPATRRRCRRFFLLLPPSLTAACAVLGLLIAVDSYIYSYASSYLPLSTSSILMASQLAFTAVFALLIVRQRFTPFSLNAVVLLTLGPVVLGLGVAGDRPEGESRSRYYLGFFMTVAASALMGLLMPLMELAYRRTREEMTYAMVIETQMVMGASGTLFCLLGMLVNKDFQAIPEEAREFELGEFGYYMVLIWDAICWQILNVGLVGVIFSASSLFGGIIVAILVPIGGILPIVFLNEKFNGSKAAALALSLWGFASYLYGELKQGKKLKQTTEVELPLPTP